MKALIRVLSTPSFFFAVVIALLVISVREGPDFNKYLYWAKAAVHGDISEIQSYVESPTGLPLTQWSAGPGLAAAPLVGLCGSFQTRVLSKVTDPSFFEDVRPFLFKHGAYLTAALFAVFFWLVMGRLLLILSDGNANWTVFGLAAAFSGTHSGFYSITCGSESLSLAPLAFLAVALVRPMKSRLADVVLVGSCTAVLIMIRPYLALYAAPTMVVTAIRIWRQTSAVRWLGWMSLLAGVAALGIGQVAVVNYWMTGDWRQSTYVFGNGDFKSFDFGSPEIAAVLAHPLHGLLAYHPLYLVGFAAMIWLAFRAPTLSERMLWGSFILITAAHIWIQAAWYQWWLATTATFGMRGMTAAGVPCVAAIMRLVSRLRTGRRGVVGIQAVTLLVAFAVTWSWLLMIRGETDYFTYAELFESQRVALRDLLTSARGLSLVLVVGLTAVALRTTLSVDEEDPGWSRTQQIATILLAALAADFLVWGWTGHVVPSLHYGVILIVCVLAVLFYRASASFAWTVEPMPAKVAVVSMLFLVMMLGWFGHLAIATHRRLSTGTMPNKPYPYDWKAAFFVSEVQSGYRDFAKIPGFDEKKERLRRFLEPYGLPRMLDDTK